MLASEIVKMEVYEVGMKHIGRVKDLVIDPQNGSVTDLVVELEKSMGRQILGKRALIGRPKAIVPMSIVQKIGDAVTLKYQAGELNEQVKTL